MVTDTYEFKSRIRDKPQQIEQHKTSTEADLTAQNLRHGGSNSTKNDKIKWDHGGERGIRTPDGR